MDPMIDRKDDIAVWQTKISALEDDEAHTSGIIALLYEAVISCLRAIIHGIKREGIEPQYIRSLEKSAATMVFWGGDHDVSRGALDKTLQHAQLLRDAVLVTLISIGDLLSRSAANSLTGIDVTLVDNRARCISDLSSSIETARYALDGSSDTYTDQPLIKLDGEELSRSLHIHVINLKRLSDSLESPAESDSDDEEHADAKLHQEVPAHGYFSALIKARFPKADAELVESLGRSNWSRYKHIQQQRDEPQIGSEVINAEVAKSDFHDSGIGSTNSLFHPEYSTYAATVVSSRANTSHKRLPPLPKSARQGEPFTCEVCERTVTIRRTKDWRAHVFKDLCAYTCVFPDCCTLGALFEDDTVMRSHIELHHCHKPGILNIICPLCSERIQGPVKSASIHLSRHMEEIALGVLPRNVECEEESDGSTSSDAVRLSRQGTPVLTGDSACIIIEEDCRGDQAESDARLRPNIPPPNILQIASKALQTSESSRTQAEDVPLLQTDTPILPPWGSYANLEGYKNDFPSLESLTRSSDFVWICCCCATYNSCRDRLACDNCVNHWYGNCCVIYEINARLQEAEAE